MLKSVMSMSKMPKTYSSYLGLGGNIGDVVANMISALVLLNSHSKIKVERVSSVYKTPPWGLEEQDWFLNICAHLKTSLTPNELLEFCLQIEKKHHRKREIRWGPRTLDLDILVYADHDINTETLTLPHPRMHDRAFVMMPLADIAPQLVIHAKTASVWLAELKDNQIEKIDLPDDWWVTN